MEQKDAYPFGKEKVYDVSSCFLSILFMDKGSDFAVS
jgi:hypothetical protein